MPTRILFASDFHLRVMRPASRVDLDFLGTQIYKLELVKDIAKTCDATVFGGDAFDRPDASPTVIIRLMQVLKGWPHIPSTVIGNHDIYGYDGKSIGSSAIGVLLEHGAIQKLDFVPLGVANVYGVHAYDEAKWMVPEGPEVKIIVAHKMITDKAIPNANCIMVEDVAKATNADVVLSGDIHAPHAVSIGGKLFLNPGSLSRMSIADRNREPKVIILTIGDDKSISYEIVSISCVPAAAVFNIKGYEARIESEGHTREFMKTYASEVMSVKAESHKVSDVLSRFLNDNNVAPKMQKFINTYYKASEQQILKNVKEE